MMPDSNICERLIAQLEELRTYTDYRRFDVAIDIAINNVRRKCPYCGDTGLHTPVSTEHSNGHRKVLLQPPRATRGVGVGGESMMWILTIISTAFVLGALWMALFGQSESGRWPWQK